MKKFDLFNLCGWCTTIIMFSYLIPLIITGEYP